MTATAPTARPTVAPIRLAPAPVVAGWQLRRSWRSAAAAPAPAFVLPAMPALLLAVVLPALFDRLALVPGFDGGAYVGYLAPGAVTLTAMLGGGFTTASLVTDLRDGYLDRLRLFGPSPLGLVLGRSAVEAARVLPGAALVLAVTWALGADVTAGVGLAVALTLTALLSAAFGHVFHLAGIASRDPATAASLAPLGILVGFLSTALVPTTVMPGWAAAVAGANPVSIVVDGVRAALAGDPASGAVLAAAAVGVTGTTLGALAASALLRRTTDRS